MTGREPSGRIGRIVAEVGLPAIRSMREIDAFALQRVQHPVRLLVGADGTDRERLQTETRAWNDRSAGGARDREPNFLDQQAAAAGRDLGHGDAKNIQNVSAADADVVRVSHDFSQTVV